MRPSTTWTGPITNTGPFINSNEARHIFSLNTCNGCHAAETGTLFMHVRPTPFGIPAELSGFMTGIEVVDPFEGVTARSFNDLERRRLEVENILNTACTP